MARAFSLVHRPERGGARTNSLVPVFTKSLHNRPGRGCMCTKCHTCNVGGVGFAPRVERTTVVVKFYCLSNSGNSVSTELHKFPGEQARELPPPSPKLCGSVGLGCGGPGRDGGHIVVTAKSAYGNVTEELFVLNLLLCGLSLCSVKVSIYLHPTTGGTGWEGKVCEREGEGCATVCRACIV